MTLRLTVVHGPIAGHCHTIVEPGTVIIGRASRAHFRFPSGQGADLWVSHTHALIEYSPPACRIHDLNSNNGTYVNGVQVSAADLKAGDELKIGHSVIRIEPDPLAETFALLPDEDANTDESPTAAAPALPASPPRPSRPPGRCPACSNGGLEPGQLVCSACRGTAARVPQILPGYLLLRERGRGGMGVVYKAVREADQRLVAVKTIHPAATARPAELGRFHREAENLRRLHHPYIVSVEELGTAGRFPYVVTDYVRGRDTRSLLARHGPLSIGSAVRITAQVLLALDHAHARGLVHRDIKPSNIMVKVAPKQRKVNVTDFGLARAYHVSQLSGLTLVGDVGGTIAYLPPEQIQNLRQSDPSSDQYSTAATLYTLLTGRFVYDFRGNVGDAIAQILNGDPVPIRDRRTDIPARLAAVIHRALGREPRDRFPSVGEFRKALLPFAR